MRLSANLGFLFRDRALGDAIRTAASHGFEAVEMHWPYDVDPGLVADVLAETGLPLLGINTSKGEGGSFGLSALPDRIAEAREAIDQALAWARIAGSRNVHVMAGMAEGPEAFRTFVDNLAYASDLAAKYGIGLLLEPINPYDAPGYFLASLDLARDVIAAVGSPSMRVMFDCYHMQIIRGDLLHTLRGNLDVIGHVQFAAVPDRTEPDRGEVDYRWLLPEIEASGYDGWFGAEYRVTDSSYAWLRAFRYKALS